MNSTVVKIVGATAAASFFILHVNAASTSVSDDIISKQREALAANTAGVGFGPQSPRDIDAVTGENARAFEAAPDYTDMNLCNIHMHEAAEHKGGEFTKYVGNGDGKGYGTGYEYAGTLSESELSDDGIDVGMNEHGGLEPGCFARCPGEHSS
jgi:hypothetical protein